MGCVWSTTKLSNGSARVSFMSTNAAQDRMSDDEDLRRQKSIDTAAMEAQSRQKGQLSLLALAMHATPVDDDPTLVQVAVPRNRREPQAQDVVAALQDENFSPRETKIEIAGADAMPSMASSFNIMSSPTRIRIPETHSNAITAEEHTRSNNFLDLKYSMRSNGDAHPEIPSPDKAAVVGTRTAMVVQQPQPFHASGIRKLQPISNIPASLEPHHAPIVQQPAKVTMPERLYSGPSVGVGRGFSDAERGAAGILPRGRGAGRGVLNATGSTSPQFRGHVQNSPVMIPVKQRGIPRPLHAMPAQSSGSQRGVIGYHIPPQTSVQPSNTHFHQGSENSRLKESGYGAAQAHESVNDDDDDDDDLVGEDDEVEDWDLGEETEDPDSSSNKTSHASGALSSTQNGSLHTTTLPDTTSTSSFKKQPPWPIQTAKSPSESAPYPKAAKFRPQFGTASDLDTVIDTDANVLSDNDDDDDDDSNYGGENEDVEDWFDDDSSEVVATTTTTTTSSSTLTAKSLSPPGAKNRPTSQEQRVDTSVVRGTKSLPKSPSAPAVSPSSTKVPAHTAAMTPTFRHTVETSKPSPHPPPMQRLPSRQIIIPGGSVSPVKSTGMGSPIVGSPLKQVSYRSNIVSTGQPVLLPMAMINGALVSKDAMATEAVGTSNAPIRDTKVVKKKRAELPSQQNLPHPTPKFGDWLNSRTMINNYIILEPLGSGSYADVKLCKEKVSGKLFAMKFINRDIMKKDKLGKQSKLDDIKREIAIMKKLNHPNVLRLYEVMDDPNMNKLFLVLEYMKHGDLLSHQKKKHPHGVMESLHDLDLHCVVLQVVLGLAYLHEQKIVHGDIKPQNILVGDHDVVKIADFGISQSLYGSKQKLSDTAGTPAFMSPEMCSGEAYSGQMADIWAVGATIFMLKFGNPPFIAKSAMQMFEKIQSDPLEFPFPVDPLLQDLLTGMMVKDPQQRMTLEDVMMHPWVTKEEHSSHYSTRHAAPQITVSNDEIDHAIDSKDQFAIIVNIRIQMMKNLQKARQEILEKRCAAHEDNATKLTGTAQVSAAEALVEEGVAHEKSLRAKTPSRHKQNKIHADNEVKDSHEMLSNEEIEYRAQLFSRKKTGSTAAPTAVGGSGKTKEQHGIHGFQDVNETNDSQDTEDDDEGGLFSSDDDDDAMAVAQSPQLLDELLLTTLSMPPLSKTKAVVTDPGRPSTHPLLQEAPISPGSNGAMAKQINHPTPVNDPEGFYGQCTALGLQFGVASLQGRRNIQEDRWVVVPSIRETAETHIWTKSAFVGLYDGHGGEECANILREQLHSWIFRNPHDVILKFPHSLQSCFEELDSYVCDYLLQKGDLSGSTATCAILSSGPEGSGKVHVIVAHVGDCRLVLSHRNHDVVNITNDHRLTLAEERDRILQLGGRVVNNRVNGVMAITRAFGDLEFKGMFSRKVDDVNASSTSSMSLHLPSSVQLNPFQKEDEKIPTLLTSRPDIHILSLDPAVHEFLLLACDGLWDVMTSDEAVDIFRDRLHFHGNLQTAAKELAQEAIRRYSNDNITVIAIHLPLQHVS